MTDDRVEPHDDVTRRTATLQADGVQVMKRIRALGVAATVFMEVLGITACGSSGSRPRQDSGGLCVPGRSVACVGPGGCQGGQSCKDDGSGHLECDCARVGDGGADTPTRRFASVPGLELPPADRDLDFVAVGRTLFVARDGTVLVDSSGGARAPVPPGPDLASSLDLRSKEGWGPPFYLVAADRRLAFRDLARVMEPLSHRAYPSLALAVKPRPGAPAGSESPGGAVEFTALRFQLWADVDPELVRPTPSPRSGHHYRPFRPSAPRQAFKDERPPALSLGTVAAILADGNTGRVILLPGTMPVVPVDLRSGPEAHRSRVRTLRELRAKYPASVLVVAPRAKDNVERAFELLMAFRVADTGRFDPHGNEIFLTPDRAALEVAAARGSRLRRSPARPRPPGQ